MGGLYDAGWRQGSLLYAPLEQSSMLLGDAGPRADTVTHDQWLVASQDCDLDLTDAVIEDPVIELRPVHADNPPVDWGIRAARLLLRDSPPQYLVSTSPRLHVAPAVLTNLLEGGAARVNLDEGRRVAVKKWLGLRYDRPAVPNRLVPLAKGLPINRRSV